MKAGAVQGFYLSGIWDISAVVGYSRLEGKGAYSSYTQADDILIPNYFSKSKSIHAPYGVVACFMMLIALCSYSYAADEQKILDSAQMIVSAWQKELTNGLKVLNHHQESGDFVVWRYTLIGDIEYDVKRSDSLVKPYELLIMFTANVEDNSVATSGVSSKNEVLARVSDRDFSGAHPWDFVVHYGLRTDTWSIVNSNKYFGYLMKGSNLQENRPFFSRINDVSIE